MSTKQKCLKIINKKNVPMRIVTPDAQPQTYTWIEIALHHPAECPLSGEPVALKERGCSCQVGLLPRGTVARTVGRCYRLREATFAKSLSKGCALLHSLYLLCFLSSSSFPFYFFFPRHSFFIFCSLCLSEISAHHTAGHRGASFYKS